MKDDFEQQIENTYSEGKQINTKGYFNINLLNQHSDELRWVEIMEHFQKKLVTEPTRVTNKTSTLIDHMYVRDPEEIRVVKVPKIAMSDFPTCLVYHSVFGTKHSHTTIKYRSHIKY